MKRVKTIKRTGESGRITYLCVQPEGHEARVAASIFHYKSTEELRHLEKCKTPVYTRGKDEDTREVIGIGHWGTAAFRLCFKPLRIPIPCCPVELREHWDKWVVVRRDTLQPLKRQAYGAAQAAVKRVYPMTYATQEEALTVRRGGKALMMFRLADWALLQAALKCIHDHGCCAKGISEDIHSLEDPE